jgi:ubiquinone/menaquinone biosynthesis C-methylase UbiE
MLAAAMSVLQAEHFVQKFIQANTGISRRLERAFFPHSQANYRTHFLELAARHLPRSICVAVDLGAGRSSRFACDLLGRTAERLVAVDASPRELALNSDADETVVADITEELPFPDASVDVAVSTSVLEHLSDVPAHLRECARILRPGGIYAAVYTGRFALSSLLNRALPEAVKGRALRLVFGDYEGVLGYAAVYDSCDPRRIACELERSGLELVVEERSYYGAYYFHGFAPLALLVLLVETVAQRLGVRALAVQSLFVARKPVGDDIAGAA